MCWGKYDLYDLVDEPEQEAREVTALERDDEVTTTEPAVVEEKELTPAGVA
jgi:hypothetical protein